MNIVLLLQHVATVCLAKICTLLLTLVDLLKEVSISTLLTRTSLPSVLLSAIYCSKSRRNKRIKPNLQEGWNQKRFKSDSMMQVSTQRQQGNPRNPHLNNAKASCFIIPERFFVRHYLGSNLSHAFVKHLNIFNCKL